MRKDFELTPFRVRQRHREDACTIVNDTSFHRPLGHLLLCFHPAAPLFPGRDSVLAFGLRHVSWPWRPMYDDESVSREQFIGRPPSLIDVGACVRHSRCTPSGAPRPESFPTHDAKLGVRERPKENTVEAELQLCDSSLRGRTSGDERNVLRHMQATAATRTSGCRS